MARHGRGKSEKVICVPSLLAAGFAKKVISMLSTKIEPLLEHDWPHQDIANAFGVSRARVTQIANELGYGVKRPKGNLSEDQWTKLLAEYPKLTVTELHRKYKISRAAIYRRLKL